MVNKAMKTYMEGSITTKVSAKENERYLAVFNLINELAESVYKIIFPALDAVKLDIVGEEISEEDLERIIIELSNIRYIARKEIKVLNRILDDGHTKSTAAYAGQI
jgi:hypothetical protein